MLTNIKINIAGKTVFLIIFMNEDCDMQMSVIEKKMASSVFFSDIAVTIF